MSVRTTRIAKRILFAAASLTGAATTASAATYNVFADGASGSDTSVNYNWDDVATIGSGVNVTGALSVDAGKIQLGGNLTVTGALSLTQDKTSNAGSFLYGIQMPSSGTTTLQASSITLNADIGTTADGGTLALVTTGDGGITLNMSLGRSGTFYIPSAFTANAGAGTITVNGSGTGSAGWRSTPVTLTGGKIDITSAVSSGAAVTLNASLASGGTVSGALSGGMSLTKGAAGTLTLTAGNTYTGSTTINGGTLAITSGGGIYRGGYRTTNITVNSGGTLQLETWGYGESTSSLGGLSAQADKINVNGGTIRVTGASTTYGRGVTVNAGGITLEAGSEANWTIDTLNDSNAWVFNSNPSVTLGGAGTGTFQKVINSGSGALTKTGTGTWNLGGANTFTGGITVRNGTLAITGASGTVASQAVTLGDASTNDSGVLALGDASNAKSLTISSLKTAGSGAANRIVAGGNAGNSTLTVNSSAGTVDTFAGIIGGTGGNQNLIALTKAGSGTLTLSGANTFTKAAQVNGGVLELAGGSWVGSDTGSQAALQMGVGASDVGEFRVSAGGTLNLSNTTVNGVTGTNASNGMRVGNSGQGTFTQTGGTVVVGTGGIWIADDLASTGVMTLSGGALTSTGSATVVATRGTGTLTINGSADVTLAGLQLGHAQGAAASSSTVNLDGGTLAVSSLYRANGTGRVYFNGGTLKARSSNANFITNTLGSAEVKSGGAVFDTNGHDVTVAQALITHATSTGGGLTKGSAGTLTLSGTGNSFTGATTVNNGTLDLAGTFSGGAYAGNISVGSSGTFKFSSSSEHTFSGTLGGSGAFQKTGSGLLTLSGGGAYSGAASVTSGVLQVTGNLSNAASTLALASGATLRGSGTLAGTVNAAAGAALTAGDGTAGTLTLGALSLAGNATLNIGLLSNYSSVAALAVTGAITNGGTVTLNLGATTLDDGVYKLISFGSGVTSTSGFTLGTTPIRGSRQTLVGLGYTAPGVGTPGYLTYTIAGANPIWVGSVTVDGVTSDSAYWKDGDSSVKNWNADGVSTYYYNVNASPSGLADAVTFSDAATGTRDVILNETVTPLAVTFSNTTAKAYTLTGTGAIAGASTTLTKSGNGVLTLGTANTFGGGTTLSNGTLRVGNDAALGSGGLAISGGRLAADASARSINSAVTFGGNASLGEAGSGALTLSGGVNLGGATRTLTVDSAVTLSGAVSNGGLTKAGNGTLVLTAANNFAGGTIVSAGALRIGAGGTTGSVAGDIANDATLEFNRGLDAGVAYAYSGVVSGTGAVKVLSGSALRLTGANTYTGVTTVESGAALTIGNGSGSGSVAAASSIVANGSLTYDGGATGTVTLGSVTTGSGSVSASGRFVKLGADISLTGAGSSITLGQLGASGSPYLEGIELVKTGMTTLTAGSISISGDVGKGPPEFGNSLTLDTSAQNGTIDLNVSLGRVGSFYKLSALVANAGTGAVNVTGTGGGNAGWRDTTVTLTGGTVTIGVNVNSGAAVTVNSSGNSTATGVLSGGMSLAKGGAGKLTLSGVNTYSGGTTVNNGILEIGGAGVVTGSLTVANGATLAYAGSAANTAGNVTLRGNLSRSGTGSLALSSLAFGSTTNAQTLDISGGTLTVAGSFKAGNGDGTGLAGDVGRDFTLTQDGGTFSVTNNGSNEFALANWGGTSAVTVSAGTFSVDSFYSPTIGQRGTGNFTVSGTGSVTFATTSATGLVLGGQSGGTGNLYLNDGTLTAARIKQGAGTGNLYLDGGTLRASASNASFMSDLTSAKVRAGGAVVDTNGFDITIGQALDEDAASTGGGLNKVGLGTLTLSVANSYTGGTTVSAGMLVIGHAGALGSTGLVSVLNGAILDLAGYDIGRSVSVASGGELRGLSNFSGDIEVGSGLSLAVANATFGGTVNVTGGTLDIGAANALGSGNAVIASGALINLGGNSLGSANLTLAGAGQGLGAMVNNAGVAAAHSGTLTLADNATIGGSGDITLSGTITDGADSRTLTKAGGGTLTIGGTANVASTTVEAGKLVVDGALTGDLTVGSGAILGGSGTIAGDTLVEGAHNPGNSPGVQNFTGTLTYAGGSTIGWELDANTATQGAPPAFDQILVDGDITFTGATALSLSFDGATSAVDWTNSFWTTQQSWVLFDASGTISGHGNLTLALPAIDYYDSEGASMNPGNFGLSYNPNDQTILITYTPVPEPSTYGLILGGLALAVAAARRRRVAG